MKCENEHDEPYKIEFIFSRVADGSSDGGRFVSRISRAVRTCASVAALSDRACDRHCDVLCVKVAIRQHMRARMGWLVDGGWVVCVGICCQHMVPKSWRMC